MNRRRPPSLGKLMSAAPGSLHHSFHCAGNIAQAVDRRRPEARALAGWLDANRSLLGLPDGDDYAIGTAKTGMPAASWRRLRTAVTRGLQAAPVVADAPAERWLDVLAARLGFDALDREILRVALYYELDERFENLVDQVSHARGGAYRLRCDFTLLALLLAADPARVEAKLHADGPVRASGLVRVDHEGDLSVIGQLGSLVRSAAAPTQDPFEQLLGRTVAATLPWDAFAHLGPEAEVAAALLGAAVTGREPGVNLLLYGPPGTGKTSFAATLAARAGARLRPVTEQDRLGGEPNRLERLSGLQLAQKLAPVAETLLLFDEAEDVFVRHSVAWDEPVTSSRVFMHRLLEQTPVPVIWPANDIAVLGPAVLRRMTMCLELKIPGVAVRTRLWRSMGEEAGVPLSEMEAARLARLVPAAPAVAATALRGTRLAGGDAGTAHLIVEGIARAVAGGRAAAASADRPDRYDPALVNAGQDLLTLADRLARPGAPRAVSFLLSGPPGTGKSAWARHLADRMGLDVLHKRASDLLGPYVGQTEANIAAAFAEAKAAGAFLVFDEADSLLGDRTGAVRNWEVTQVNEMLTWMEQHPLPFACTTNLPDRLDPASLRRFLVKLRFTWLTAAQARLAWVRFFTSEPPDGLDALTALTPADFALAHRRAGLTGEDGEQAALLRLLEEECKGRDGTRGTMGFLTT